MRPADRLIQLARRFEGDINPPASLRQISNAENRLGYPLPETIRTLYEQANGILIHDWIWEFPAVENLVLYRDYRSAPISEAPVRGGGKVLVRDLMFLCDAMIDAPSYWMRIDPAAPDFGVIYCDGDDPWWISAASFDAFVSKIEASDGDPFVWWDESAEDDPLNRSE